MNTSISKDFNEEIDAIQRSMVDGSFHETDKQTCIDEARLSHSLQDSLNGASRRMQEDELKVSRSNLIIDGEIHKCGTVGKERGEDRAYAINRFPRRVVAHWRNWRTTGAEMQNIYQIRERQPGLFAKSAVVLENNGSALALAI